MSYPFPKDQRLRRRADYRKVGRRGKRLVGDLVVIDFSASFKTRLGITVTKKYGKAHERNRFKRMVREGFRLSQHQLAAGRDLNVRPRSAAKRAKSQEIKKELIKLLSA